MKGRWACRAFLRAAHDFTFFALLGGALTLSLMLGTGGAAVIAGLRVDDLARRRIAGAALMLWAVAGALSLVAIWFLLPGLMYAMAAGCALALIRLALALQFHLRPALPKGADFASLLRAGFRPMVASVLYLAAALLGETLTGAALYALFLLIANVAMRRDEAGNRRLSAYLTTLVLLMAVPLALLPGWKHALGGLVIAWLAAISLTAGLSALFHLPGNFYEAYLPVRAWFLRRRSNR
jgi:hypothetical protein